MPAMAKRRQPAQAGEKPNAWVFDGYLMGEPKTGVWRTANAPEIIGNTGSQVFDGYLMANGISTDQSPRVCETRHHQRPGEHCEPVISSGFLEKAEAAPKDGLETPSTIWWMRWLKFISKYPQVKGSIKSMNGK